MLAQALLNAPAGGAGASDGGGGGGAAAPPAHTFAQLISMALAAPSPEPLSPTHRFLVFQGASYAALGLLFLLLPQLAATLMLIDSASMPAEEVAMLRLCGFTVFLIGYFYITGARTNSMQFVAVTCFDRGAMVPPAMLLCWLLGCRGQICLAFGVLDPLLTALTVLSQSDNALRKLFTPG